MWHRSCRREGYQDKVSSVKPGAPGKNQCQGGMLSPVSYTHLASVFQGCVAPVYAGYCEWYINGIYAVSYTHLDVYKRQTNTVAGIELTP